MAKKKIGILTGGGDCPGLNPAIRGCVYMAEKLGYECIGFLEGWKGIIENNTIELNSDIVKDLVSQGGTFLGSSRTNPYKRDGGVEAVKENFEKNELTALVAMGGEDTLGVANNLYNDLKLPVVGVPKTMDNDLSGTDYTFGFYSAASVAVEALERLKDTAKSHRRIIVLEVMGRHAGWVSLFTALGGSADYCCIPEKKVDVEKMIKVLKKNYDKRKYGLVVTSEAAELPTTGDGEVQALDDFGHIQLSGRDVGEKLAKLIQDKSGIETRHAVIGHIQRGGAPTLFDRILGTRAGVAAANFVEAKTFGVLAGLRGNEIEAVPLAEAVGTLKVIDEKWFDVMDVFFS